MPHTKTDAPLDTIHVNSETHLSWGDRLRVLVGRSIHTHTSIAVWNAHVGDDVRLLTEVTESRTWVEPFIRRGRSGGYAMSPADEGDAKGAT